MTSLAASIILVTVLATSFLSGIFGMAGGVIFMGVLTALVPVATAMIIHGAVQMVSNGYRAYLWRRHIHWSVFRRYALGSAAAVLLLFALSWHPDKQMVYLMLGLVTPPMGLSLFLITDIAQVSMRAILRAVMPLYIPLLVTLALLTLVPELSLFLPKMIR